jgi:putative DNA primase/helicase
MSDYAEQDIDLENYKPYSTQDMLVLLLQVDGKKRARARTATDLIIKHHFATMRDTKELYVYQDGYYQKKGEDVVAAEVSQLWAWQCTTGDIREIIEAHIKPRTLIERDTFNTDLTRTCVKNGVLNLITGELEPFDPKHKFTFQLNITYDTTASCPKIEQFLRDVVESPNDIQTLLEVFAYCLYRSYPTAKIIVLLGEGRNGKSTILSLLKLFLGVDNVRNMTMQQLEHNEYAKGFLFGKHANINPDIGNKKINTQGVIKNLTGGSDEIETNVKYHDHMHFNNFCKLVYGTNDLPQSDDTTDAWISRWIFLRFPHKFKAETICPFCHTQHSIVKDLHLQLAEENSGLLNLVMATLKRMRDNNWEFTLSDKAKDMESSYESLSDPVAGFVKECVIDDHLSKVGKTELYDTYRAYCGELGETVQSSNHFTVRFKQHMPDVTEVRSGMKRYWSGIRIKEELKQADLGLDNPQGGLSDRSNRYL